MSNHWFPHNHTSLSIHRLHCQNLCTNHPHHRLTIHQLRLSAGNHLPTIDESTHQILSYGLLFSTFSCFPYTAGPLTSIAPMQPSPTIVWTFAWSPPTIPYTHHTIGPVPRRRPLIWPTDHIVTFPFLSLFSLPDTFFHSLTNRRSSHHTIGTLPYVSPHTNLVLVLLIICI